MSVFNRLLRITGTDDNLVHTCQYVLDHYRVKHTNLQVSNLVNEHLAYPSLLAVMDTLSEYGIENAALQKGNYNYAAFEVPFVCAIQRPDWSQSYFTVVTAVDDSGISYLDPVKNIMTLSSENDFEQMDKDIVLLLDGTDAKDEIDYNKNLRKVKREQLTKPVPFVFFLIALISSIGYSLITYPFPLSGIATAFLLLTTVGFLTGLILVWHEIDAHNPFLREVCGGGAGKLNCSAVLNSKGASLFGMSWSVIGFSYFATILLTQLLFGASSLLFLSYWFLLSLLALPYTIYSIYYQWKVVKQWCPLCLVVQAVLFLSGSLLLVYTYQYGLYPLTAAPLATLVFIGISFLGLTSWAIPLLKSAKESGEYQKKWKRLRYNPDIFNTLLQKENAVLYPTDRLGLLVGSPDARYEIIKVCNPYCGPCARAHPELDELVHANPNIKVRIIFTASGEESDRRTAPVQHLLAIQERDGKEAVQQALDSWYLADNKDYAVFASKYPMDGELEKQGDKIKEMRAWCDRMKIRATPTFFVNGYELPDSYRIGELKHIFKEAT